MKTLRIAAFLLVVPSLCGVLAGCGEPAEQTAEPEYDLFTVQRGDISVDVTSSGNLVYARQEELSFQVSGTVGEVLVEEGDTVEEGQVLAILDTPSVLALEKAAAQGRLNLKKAEEALENARNPYSQSDITQAELAVVNAEVAVDTARSNLEQALNPYDGADIAQAELAVISAEAALDNAQEAFQRSEDRYNLNPTVPEWIRDYEQKKRQLILADENLAQAEETLAEMQAGPDPLAVEQKQKQLADAEARLANAEQTLAEMQAGGDPLEVELGQAEVSSARAALDEALERLEQTALLAPFSGLITSATMEAGQAVKAGAVIVLTDPNDFEATMLVNEIDILQVRENALASVELDAMPGLVLPARVTSIAAAAAPQQGVVNYRVKAELISVAEARAGIAPEGPVELPAEVRAVIDRAVAEGQMTREQADALVERLEQAGASISAVQLQQALDRLAQLAQRLTSEQIEQLRERFAQDGGLSGGLGGRLQGGPGTGQLRAGTSLAGIQLREGLSVTVTIVQEQRNDVLLVPNRAVSVQGADAYVEVVTDGEISQRQVVTGLSDWQYTEITQGLTEGEKVAVRQTSGSSTTTATPQRGQFQFLPGGGLRP